MPLKIAIEAFRAGKFVILVDDPERENEADLVIAAEHCTKEAMGFMIRHSSGVITVPMTAARLKALQLPQMCAINTETNRTAFTISVDAAALESSGMSASDRAFCARKLADPKAIPEDFRRPGHMFPLQAKDGGVLKRAGHTEGSVDLAKLSGLEPCAVIAELVDDSGEALRGEQIIAFSKAHQIPILEISELIKHRRHKEKLVERLSKATVPTEYGNFDVYVFRSLLDGIEHLAQVKGPIDPSKPTLVRVHSECLTGDVLGSVRCDCGAQLNVAISHIAKEGGVLIYLRGHEGRGVGLSHKIRAYHLQEQGLDTVEANLELNLPIDSREYGIGAQILSDLGVRKMRLMTNNPAKYGGLDGYDLEIVERVPIDIEPRAENRRYLKTKREKLGHLVSIQ